MDVNKRNVEQIFDPTSQLQAPLFQRPYVWRQLKNWQPLWESIQELADQRVGGTTPRPRFLGTIVLDQLPTPTGTITKRQVIDGQQRLTTLQLALAAVRNLCNQRAIAGSTRAAAYRDAFAKLTTNHVPLSDEPDERFKIYPTNSDRSYFRDVMTSETKQVAQSLVASAGETDALIPRCYIFFDKSAENWLDAEDEEEFVRRVGALYQCIKDDLSLVVIDLDERDDAQVIFETLNALGTPLLPADLVKNFLFHFAEGQGENTQQLYDQYWVTFDTDSAYWRQEVRQGRLNRPRLDLFLQHYLTLITSEEATATQLFQIFREHVHSSGESAAVHLARLRQYGDVYRSFETYPADSPEGIFFYRLDQLDTTTVYPLLMEVVKQNNQIQQREELRSVFKLLESFLARRVVCELTTKNYNRFFTDMIRKLRDSGSFSTEAIREVLLESTADTARFPDDEEFRSAWMNIAAYRRLVRKRLRMILEALNTAMHTDMTEDVYIREKLTIEHLMPQDWQVHWPLPETVTPDVRNQLVHTFGNLTLLTSKLNPAVSNSSWQVKRPQILTHSVLKMNHEFYHAEEWNEDVITNRTESLFQLAATIWPRPS